MSAASERLTHAVELCVVSLLTTSLHEADFGAARFDKVFGVHVPPLLRGEPDREPAVIRGCLAPTDTLHVIFQPFTREQVDGPVTSVVGRRGR